MHNATLAPSWKRGQGTLTSLFKGLADIVFGIVVGVYCDCHANGILYEVYVLSKLNDLYSYGFYGLYIMVTEI